MDNIVFRYFRLRRQGMKPAFAWAYACSINDFDVALFV